MLSTNSAFRLLRPQRNLTGELIGRLTKEIDSGHFSPGARLPTEHELMAAFGVSRTVVREAIAALRAEGLVKTRQGSGAFVSDDPHRQSFRIDREGFRSIDKVFDVMELRICVEVEAAGLAAERRTKASLTHIARTTSAFTKAIARPNPAIDADFDFHAAIGAATGNPYFSSFLDFIGRQVIPRRNAHLEMSDRRKLEQHLQRIDKEHRAIWRAIAERNVAVARRAMRAHLLHSRERYVNLLGRSVADK